MPAPRAGAAGGVRGLPSDGSDTDAGETDSDDVGETEGSAPSSSGADPTDTGDGGSTGTPLEQPEHGMFAECTAVTDCVGLSQCVTTTDGADGLCTNGGCADPGTDCDPSPGGTAPTICAAMGGTSSAVCALDCSSGQICPTGMDCHTLPGGSICI